VFLRFVLRALAWRRQRLALAFSALVVAATLATVLFGIYGSVERRIREEFRAYGANIAISPASGVTVPLEIVAAAEGLGADAAPFLVTAGLVGSNPVPVAGFVGAKIGHVAPYWHVNGSSHIAAGECLAGELAASQLQLGIGAWVPLENAPCRLKGIVSTGGAEDRELLVPFETAATMAGVHDAASIIEVRAPGERVDAIRSALGARFPMADVRLVRSVAGTESNVVVKLRAALSLLTLLILVITTLCVSGNFSEMVIERSKEIGILKALGAAERRIATFFISESAALALGATLAGYAIGLIAAAAIGREVFGGVFRIEASWFAFACVAGVMLSVASMATALAASRIWSIQPAVILRGE